MKTTNNNYFSSFHTKTFTPRYPFTPRHRPSSPPAPARTPDATQEDKAPPTPFWPRVKEIAKALPIVIGIVLLAILVWPIALIAFVGARHLITTDLLNNVARMRPVKPFRSPEGGRAPTSGEIHAQMLSLKPYNAAAY